MLKSVVFVFQQQETVKLLYSSFCFKECHDKRRVTSVNLSVKYFNKFRLLTYKTSNSKQPIKL